MLRVAIESKKRHVHSESTIHIVRVQMFSEWQNAAEPETSTMTSTPS